MEKTTLMTSNTSGNNTEIKVNELKLETVASFKHLGSVLSDEGSKPEILSRIAQMTEALASLKQSQASSTWAPLDLTRVPRKRYSPGQHRRQQH